MFKGMGITVIQLKEGKIKISQSDPKNKIPLKIIFFFKSDLCALCRVGIDPYSFFSQKVILYYILHQPMLIIFFIFRKTSNKKANVSRLIWLIYMYTLIMRKYMHYLLLFTFRLFTYLNLIRVY